MRGIPAAGVEPASPPNCSFRTERQIRMEAPYPLDHAGNACKTRNTKPKNAIDAKRGTHVKHFSRPCTCDRKRRHETTTRSCSHELSGRSGIAPPSVPAIFALICCVCRPRSASYIYTLVLTIPATRNRTRDHLIAAAIYSQMLYQLSYSRIQEQRSKQTFVYDWRSRRESFLCHGARCRDTQRPPTGARAVCKSRSAPLPKKKNVRGCASRLPQHPAPSKARGGRSATLPEKKNARGCASRRAHARAHTHARTSAHARARAQAHTPTKHRAHRPLQLAFVFAKGAPPPARLTMPGFDAPSRAPSRACTCARVFGWRACPATVRACKGRAGAAARCHMTSPGTQNSAAGLCGSKVRSSNNHARANCRDPGSNRGPSDLRSDALPTELSRLLPRSGVKQITHTMYHARFCKPSTCPHPCAVGSATSTSIAACPPPPRGLPATSTVSCAGPGPWAGGWGGGGGRGHSGAQPHRRHVPNVQLAQKNKRSLAETNAPPRICKARGNPRASQIGSAGCKNETAIKAK